MPRVSATHRAVQQDRILDAAVVCFLRRGVRATTMADIIAEAELSAGAIYGYFASKQELTVAAISRQAGELAQRLQRAAAEHPLSPSELIGELAQAIAEYGDAPTLIVQMWGEATSDPEFAALATNAIGAMGTLFGGHLERWARDARGRSAEEAAAWARRVTPALLGLMQGLLLQRSLLPGFAPEAYLAGIDALLGGFDAQPPVEETRP